MSTLSVKGNGSGSGAHVLQSANSNSNRTITLPDNSGTLISTATPGTVLQVANYQTTAPATGTTTMPADNTIPQNTEGDQYMSLAFTPTSATSKLKIDVILFASPSNTNQWISTALFQDTAANAIASSAVYQTINTAISVSTFTYFMTAGTTSSTTFKVRAGLQGAGTLTFNGSGGVGTHGGVLTSSITITEISA